MKRIFLAGIVALVMGLAATHIAQAQDTTVAKTVTEQPADQWLMSTFRGASVYDQDDKVSGTLSDVLWDKSGNVQAYLIEFGGFLGMGTKTVALVPSIVEWVPRGKVFSGRDAYVLKVKLPKDEFWRAAPFKKCNDGC